MKRKPQTFLKNGPCKYVDRMKRLLVLFSAVAIVVIMVLLVFAVNLTDGRRPLFIALTVAAVLIDLIVYGFYAMRVSMGAVIGIEVTTKVVHLITKRKTFTYDVRTGCVSMVVKKNRYIGTFETQDSRDQFIFYRHAPFTKYSDEGFTIEDIRKFYPRIDEIENSSKNFGNANA